MIPSKKQAIQSQKPVATQRSVTLEKKHIIPAKTQIPPVKQTPPIKKTPPVKQPPLIKQTPPVKQQPVKQTPPIKQVSPKKEKNTILEGQITLPVEQITELLKTTLLPQTQTISTQQMVPPKKLFIYYAWPLLVNGSLTTTQAIAVFNNYDLGVFGNGLENPVHPQHNNTNIIINGTSADIYGEINCTLALSIIKNKIDQWSVMGGSTKKVMGIFCNLFGYDYGLTRQKQNDIVDYIHSKSLKAFVNA